LADTVGFVRHLPHQLVEAFRSTLEEVAEADLIVHVVDAADVAPLSQLRAVREVFADIGALDVPELVVVNKADAAEPDALLHLLHEEPSACVVSARTGEGIDALRERIAAMVPRPDVPVTLLVPFEHGEIVSKVHQHGEVQTVSHTAEGTHLEARLPAWLAGEVASYAV
jgi:GTP-binding protein HflX